MPAMYSGFTRGCVLGATALVSLQGALASPVAIPLVNPSFESPSLASPPAVSFANVQSEAELSGNWVVQPLRAAGITFGNWGNLPAASDGAQYLFGSRSDKSATPVKVSFRIHQAVGPLEANTVYEFRVDLRPGLGATDNDAAYVQFTADSEGGSVFESREFHTTTRPTAEDFRLSEGKWVTVTVRLSTATHGNLVGKKVRVVAGGEELMIDNARLTKDTDTAPSLDKLASGKSDTAPIDWLSNLDEARARGTRDRKRVIVLFANRSSDTARQFEDKALGEGKVAQVIRQKYIPLRLDMAVPESQELAKRLSVFRAGVAVIYDMDGSYLRRIDRPMSSDELVQSLNY